jgi:uncharacterized protein YcfL
MKKMILTALISFAVVGCSGYRHDTVIHNECSRGANNTDVSVKNHLDCEQQKQKSR